MNVFFFYKESKSKKNLFLCLGREWGGGGLEIVKYFFTKNLNQKNKIIFSGWGGVGRG